MTRPSTLALSNPWRGAAALLSALALTLAMSPAPPGIAIGRDGSGGPPRNALTPLPPRAANRDANPPSSPARVPVREVTVFKDGHAFVVRRGVLPTDSEGHVVLDELPSPVLGTFWPFSSDAKAKLHSVVAGKRDATVERDALTVRELIEANAGADVIVTESGRTYSATIKSVPGADRQPRGTADVVFLRTLDGVRVVPLAAIQHVTFRSDYNATIGRVEERNRMTLRLEWSGQRPRATADVGMMYLEKGLRWIPSYKIVIDGAGKAHVSLEATLVNELTDLENVTTNLVIGVPKFEFEHTRDPMSLQDKAAQLSPYFQKGSETAYALSNAIMTQTARMGEVRRSAVPSGAAASNAAEVAGGKNEDLFVFTVKDLTLAKGQRMVVPVTEFSIPYEDVYKLNVSMTPPREVCRQFNSQRKAQLAALFHAPKAVHNLRLTNNSPYPLTTAPALLLNGGQVLAQGMMTYTSVGGTTDLAVTTAVDVRVTKRERETDRDPKAHVWRGHTYARIDLSGTIQLDNLRGRTIDVEVTRHVLGNVTDVGAGGEATRSGLLESSVPEVLGGAAAGYPYWWGWYSWPWWWHNLNGISRVDWKVRLEPGQKLELGYSWHYFWR